MFWVLLSLLIFIFIFAIKETYSKTNYFFGYLLMLVVVTSAYVAISAEIYNTSKSKLKYVKELELHNKNELNIEKSILNGYSKNGYITYELYSKNDFDFNNPINFNDFNNSKIIKNDSIPLNKAIAYVYNDFIVYKYLFYPDILEINVKSSCILKISTKTDVIIKKK